MTTTTTTNDLVERLTAALNAHERAKTERKPDDNPFHQHDLKQMATAGLLKSADRHPARSMASCELGFALESSRIQVLSEAKADKSARRMAVARARAARKQQFDAITASPVRPDPERMREAWVIVTHLLPIITQVANGKRQWAKRLLGSVTDDVAGAVVENMALLLAKSDKDLGVLEQAARQLGEQAERTRQIPGDQTDAEKAAAKAVAKGRKWLMQVVNNRVMDTLIDVYCRSHNLRSENIEVLATVMANLSGVGDDPMTNRFKADRAPAFMGTKFPRPGGVDAGLLAAAINAAISDRGLDRLVELLLGGARTNGEFPWTDRAQEVFYAAGDDGPWMWQVVCQATTGRNRDGKEWTTQRARKARGDAARDFVRNAFEWLPSLVVSVVEAFDQHAVAFTVKAGETRAIMASDFELFYLPDAPDPREVLAPVLRFASVEQAAHALIENLAAHMSGEETLRSLLDA